METGLLCSYCLATDKAVGERIAIVWGLCAHKLQCNTSSVSLFINVSNISSAMRLQKPGVTRVKLPKSITDVFIYYRRIKFL